MNIKKYFTSPLQGLAKSILRQEQIHEVEHEEPPLGRQLTAYEIKKVNQIQAWASKQRKKYYDEFNPSVKNSRL